MFMVQSLRTTKPVTILQCLGYTIVSYYMVCMNDCCMCVCKFVGIHRCMYVNEYLRCPWPTLRPLIIFNEHDHSADAFSPSIVLFINS